MLASDMTQQQAHTVTEGLRRGEYKILFVSPERFVRCSFVALLQSVPEVLMMVLMLLMVVMMMVMVAMMMMMMVMMKKKKTSSAAPVTYCSSYRYP